MASVALFTLRGSSIWFWVLFSSTVGTLSSRRKFFNINMRRRSKIRKSMTDQCSVLIGAGRFSCWKGHFSSSGVQCSCCALVLRCSVLSAQCMHSALVLCVFIARWSVLTSSSSSRPLALPCCCSPLSTWRLRAFSIWRKKTKMVDSSPSRCLSKFQLC